MDRRALSVALAVTPDLGAAALDYARDCFEVFPLHADKTPRTPNGWKDATTDDASIKRWWSQWPTALIGCRVPTDIVILDVDARHGGLETWKKLKADYGSPPTTRVHYSGRGDKGGHLWFKRPSGKLSIKGLNAWAREHGTGEAVGKHSWVSGIDLLHHNHRYTILPPSPHPVTGLAYWWAEAQGSGTEPAEMPAWLAKFLIEPPAPPEIVLSPRSSDDESIADWFSATSSWSDLLVPEGWTLVRGSGDEDGSAWRHPNATSAQSATVRHGCLFVYSPNTDFEPTAEGDRHGYTRFRAYAELEHRGDMKLAARAARVMKGDGGNYDLPATLTGGVGAEGRPATPEPVRDGLTPVCWADLFAREHRGESWLLRPVVAEGRQAAVWAVHKTGKSLFSLDVAVRVALGRPYATDQETKPTNVIYLDMEMTEDDLQERMDGYGYGPDDADALQRHLHYYLLPNLPPLDSPAGAAALCHLVEHHQARLVVIDTMARVVIGEENSADTYRDFYRHTGSALKRMGVALFRLDHAGKDPSKGQRGSSSKGDDVDVIYELKKTETGFTLITTASRIGWVPQRSSFKVSQEPFLSFAWNGQDAGWPAGTKELADALDDIAGDADLSHREAQRLLLANGHHARFAVIQSAVRFRSEKHSDIPKGLSE